MNTLSYSNPQSQAFDRLSIAAADLRSDAAQGRQLMRELDAKWFAEGQAMFHDGQPLADCWSPAHARGWRYAQGLTSDAVAVPNWPVARPVVHVEVFGGRKCPHCGSTATRKTAQGYRECSDCGGIF